MTVLHEECYLFPQSVWGFQQMHLQINILLTGSLPTVLLPFV